MNLIADNPYADWVGIQTIVGTAVGVQSELVH